MTTASPENKDLEQKIRAVWRQVCNKREESEYQQLQSFLSTGRDDVLAEVEETKDLSLSSRHHLLLRPTTMGADIRGNDFRKITKRPHQMIIRSRHGKEWSDHKTACQLLSNTESPMPVHSSAIMIRKSFAVADARELTYVPSSMEHMEDKMQSDDGSDIFDMFDTQMRERQVEYGAQYVQQEANKDIDEMLRNCLDESSTSDDESVEKVLTAISNVMKQSFKRIYERYEEMTKKPQAEPAKNDNEEMVVVNDDDSRFLKGADSYRNLYCRRCFTYDCNIHGVLDKASLKLQCELGIQRERDEAWQIETNGSKVDVLLEDCKAFGRVEALTDFHKIICKQMFLIFEGDVDKMSVAMRAPAELLAEYIQAKNFAIPDKLDLVKQQARYKTNHPYYSVKNYNSIWYRRIENAEIHPFFAPCAHDEECADGVCSCVDNHFFCTKACVWGPRSRNFFRGCDCQGQCNTVQCTCYAAKRECDPDLCKCQTCCDPIAQPAKSQRCRNDNITAQRHAHLLIAKSAVRNAGWGCFSKYALKKGDFIHEYVGEMISQEEADRRGQFYDIRNQSFLFNLCSDHAIDGNNKGNKTRFINHSSKPNCCTKTFFVNGDYRIGLFANQDIPAQRELFFDYRYSESMDNRLIKKTAKTVPWMRNDSADKAHKRRSTQRSTEPSAKRPLLKKPPTGQH